MSSRQAAMAKKVNPADGLTAAFADMLHFLLESHGALYDMAMQYAENAGIKREHVSYIGIFLAAVYLIFGSAARLFCNLIGFGYPMYASVKAIRTKETDDDTELIDLRASWSDLPMEMLAEIIKHLDFKSRMQLRATARLEKEMVETWRMKVDCVSVHAYRNNELVVWMDNKPLDGSIEKMTSLISSLVKYTKTRQFQMFARYDGYLATDSIGLLEKITEGGNFKFPILNINHFNDEDFQRLIKMSTPGTQVLHFYRPPKRGFERVFRDYTTLPVMLEASVIQLLDKDDDFTLSNTVVEAWIRNDQIVGKKVLWWLGGYNDENYELEYVEETMPLEGQALSTFKNQFGERLVAETAKSARIRMDDESKHIVVRIVNEDDRGYTEVIAIWEVIPADLLEENFDKKSGHVFVEC